MTALSVVNSRLPISGAPYDLSDISAAVSAAISPSAPTERAPNAGPTPRLIVILPAHNEADNIDIALCSIEAQTRLPEIVIVVADNCTDATVDIVATRGGALIVSSVANKFKKAGALNQVLSRILPDLEPTDAILVMDADSALDHQFIEGALARLGKRERSRPHRDEIGGVGGSFLGGRGGGFVGMLQRNEYARYARDTRRLKGRVLVLTGTAAVFSVAALRAVIDARARGAIPGSTIPGGAAQVYDTGVLTEDNELTLALLHLGYGIISPRECRLETEVMSTWGDLWRQRVRWKRGALENLVEYGLTRVTARYWGRQLLTFFGIVVTAAYLATIVFSLADTGTLHLHEVWLAVTVVFIAERVITVNRRGWWQMFLASILVVEMSYDFFLQAAQAKACWDMLRHSERDW